MANFCSARVFPSAVLAILLCSAGVAGATCLEQVGELAKQRQVSTEPPTAGTRDGELTSQRLRESGGVVKPPPVADQSVITPPPKSGDRMPTLPDVSTAPKGSPSDEATERASLQALLTAARLQAERGEEKQCLDQLRKAHELLQRPQ